MIFKLTNSSFGLIINDQDYEFDHVNSVTIEDPEEVHIARGLNRKNTSGISYRTNSGQPTVVTINVMDLPLALLNLLETTYQTESRFKSYIIAEDGSRIDINNGILQKRPFQGTLDESEGSLAMDLVIESFDVKGIHKS